jgi:DNA repair protein SbcD/Mre11
MPNESHPIRVLLLADSHLGFDLPVRPRSRRRRRGYDLRANYEAALEPAREGKVDLVIHGGDLFHRSRVLPSLAYDALRPLVEVAESGVPVFVVPGNHERSRIPHERFGEHRNLHVFRGPGTFLVDVRGCRVAVAGFPYQRHRIRERFPQVLEDTGWRQVEADLRLLCFHHCVEGATVGPGDYTFRHSPDVIRCADLPAGCAAVLSGHIHRHQVLRRDLQGMDLPTPVLYPGSAERTSFAEMGEEKGYLLLELEPSRHGGDLVRRRFVPLPSRPMLVRELHPRGIAGTGWSSPELGAQLAATLADAPPDAVLRIRIHGEVPPEARTSLAAAHLRSLTPTHMNLEVVLVDERAHRRSGTPGIRRQPGSGSLSDAKYPLPGLPQVERPRLGGLPGARHPQAGGRHEAGRITSESQLSLDLPEVERPACG